MRRRFAVGVLLCLSQFPGIAAESLEATLRAANVPVEKFTVAERRADITSFAIATGEPFLLAYYVDDGSGRLQSPLYVIRYARDTGDLRRAQLRNVDAVFKRSIPMYCLGSALRIREYSDTILIETHVNPSAGCVIILSLELSLRTAVSGWLLGLMGGKYVIVQTSEVHFMAVHPLHIEVFDLKLNRSVVVYPSRQDRLRREYSRLVQSHISEKWCIEHNAPCDPEEFDTSINGALTVNEAARAFGFEASFDAGGFGDDAEIHVEPRTVAYVFRERGGRWQFRQFLANQLQSRFGSSTIQELVRRTPNAAFEITVPK